MSSRKRMNSPNARAPVSVTAPMTPSLPADGASKHMFPPRKTNQIVGLITFLVAAGVGFCFGLMLSRESSLSWIKSSRGLNQGIAVQNLETCAGLWGQCGGIGHTGPTCCLSGTFCKYVNDGWSMCVSDPGSSCVSDWGQCGGSGYTGPDCCANAGSLCTGDGWYKQCIPAQSAPTAAPTLAPTCPVLTTPAPTTTVPPIQVPEALIYYDFEDQTAYSARIIRARNIFYDGQVSAGSTTLQFGSGYSGFLALEFTANNAAVTVGNSFGLLDFTLDSFIKIDREVQSNVFNGAADNSTLWFSKFASADDFQWVISINYRTLRFDAKTKDCGVETLTYVIPAGYLGTWKNLKASLYETEIPRVYNLSMSFDGVVTSRTFECASGLWTTTQPVRLGSRLPNSLKIDEVRIWNSAVPFSAI